MTETSTPVRVIAFPGAPNLPTFVAMAHGFFRDEGLDVAFETTPSSVDQMGRLTAGEFDVAFTAFDNVVAYSEGQGAFEIEGDPGLRVVMGATQLELSLVVAPQVETFADLRGRSLALDAVATGFAFVLYDMVERGGLSREDVRFCAVGATPQRWQSVKAGEHAGTLTIEPFTSLAERAGFRVLDTSTRLYDAYQGGVIAARRPWIEANAATLRAFLRAILAGLRWTCDPANGEAAQALLLARMPQIKPAAAGAVMASLLSPRSGLTPNGAILPDGMRTVLDLRSRYGPGGALTDIDRYLDLSPHRAALEAG